MPSLDGSRHARRRTNFMNFSGVVSGIPTCLPRMRRETDVFLAHVENPGRGDSSDQLASFALQIN
jgi:hypothetical protein